MTNGDMDAIDLVVPWVDGNDPAWKAERNKYTSAQIPSEGFYRDWGVMRYWFRGVEKNTPWIRKIHFITWGHLPPWLDTEHPKLHIVRHEDYLSERYLPTFSSIPIELNVHLIEGLAEQFIMTNDDIFFFERIEPEEYFQEGLPCDYLSILPITERCTSGFGHILLNNIATISKHFSPSQCAEKYPSKWFSPIYSKEMIDLNQDACRWKNFLGFNDHHSANALRKSVYTEVWKAEYPLLEMTCRSKLRSNENVSNWLMRYWQLASGQFIPYMQKGRRSCTVGAPEEQLRDAILSSDTRVLCLNEGAEEFDFEPRAAYIKSLFERRLPDMCSFEKF